MSHSACKRYRLIWVQSGCNNTSRGLLRAPKWAIGAVDFQSVTSETSAVTAEAAGSSPVVPAIHSQAVSEWCFHSILPTISSTPSLDGLPFDSERVKEFVLSGDHLVRNRRECDRSRRAYHLKQIKCDKPFLILYDLWGENASKFLIDCASGCPTRCFGNRRPIACSVPGVREL